MNYSIFRFSEEPHSGGKPPSRKAAAPLVFFVLMAALLLPSCVQSQKQMETDLNNLKSDYYETQKNLSEVRSTVSYLSRDVEVLKKQTENVASEEAIKNLREGQASMYTQISDLLKEVQVLRGRFDENKHLIEKNLKDKLRQNEVLVDKVDSIDNRLDNLEGRMTEIKQRMDSLASLGDELDLRISELEKLQTSAEDARIAYNSAYSSFKAERYEEARKKFQRFLKDFPDHDLAGNAQFWLAETYYFQDDFENAILLYDELLNKYPRSRKVPSALLKQGLAFLQIGDKRAGSRILKDLIERHPDAPQAETARAKLKSLSGE